MSQLFQSFEVCDLALGKPPLYWLSSRASIKDAIEMIKELGLTEISVWDCSCSHEQQLEQQLGGCQGCRCVGAVNTLDMVCFLAADEQLRNLEAALLLPVSNLLPKRSSIQHVGLHARLTKALELVVQGAQYLVVPLPYPMKKSFKFIATNNNRKQSRWPCKDHCWISQEAVMRFMMACIAALCPVPMFSIEELGIINQKFMFIGQDAEATAALELIRQASENMTAVAVVQTSSDTNSTELKLVGDISPSTLRNCDEKLTAAALATLSAGDFLSFIQDSKRGSRHFLEIIRARIIQKLSAQIPEEQQVLPGTLGSSKPESCEDASGSASSDSEHDSSGSSSLPFSSGSWHRNRGGCLTCRPWSSLVAVMAQALAHRSSYIWVTDAENTLVGIVTHVDIIRVLVKKLQSDAGLLCGSSQKLFSSTPKIVVNNPI